MTEQPTSSPVQATQADPDWELGSGQMFDSIAQRYDLLNRVLSMGLDRGWRKKAVRALQVPSAGRVLDLASGTADIAIAVARHYSDCEVLGVDPSAGMLAVGMEKLQRAKLQDRVELTVGDAQALKLEDNSFDACSMAFGIRNVPDRGAALAEIARVVRGGGQIAILELSTPRSGLQAWASRIHVKHIVPMIGGLLSGPEAYQHLRDSMNAFPSDEDFLAMMAAAGLKQPQVQRLGLGVCGLFTASAPESL
ncbi:MAG: bifunctional demethylmenaquinone methyltransferase/2-methoxy-6-polyprenyl-1,4-benzoquinol methylase UbiE [Rickettsiales bacterium]|nr:bifunctional demethylmenaquinone methyltransferase/2-methoxy-6-polyprenyl-1,4-benzoquinol methylase UbiE [Rickettsiales bacterium]